MKNAAGDSAEKKPWVKPKNWRARGPGRKEIFWSKVDKDGEIPKHMPHLGKCWNWTASTDGHGYGVSCFGTPAKKIMCHRLSWIKSVGEIPVGLWVLHHCDNPLCVNPKHLWLGTRQDNTDDMISKGRHCHGEESSKLRRGELHPRHKLTNEQVVEIRKAYKPREVTLKQLAKKYDTNHTTISRIAKGEIWTHI